MIAHRLFVHFVLLLMMLSSLSCSKKKYATAPPSPGKVTIENRSGETLVVREVIQTRGNRSVTRELGRNVVNSGSYSLTNYLDNTNSKYFDGGDVVTVHYRSLYNDPDNPDVPIFSGSWSAEINGSKFVRINQNGGSGN
ncbi:MAG: hypothetical protein GY855_13410 [candidate division Zixibacteria bacterium]|nr:hypothetical protein [candidate division Zixibacteria bacterium]